MRAGIVWVALGAVGCEALDGPDSVSAFFPETAGERIRITEPTDFTVSVALTPQEGWDLARVRVFVSVMAFVEGGDAEAAELVVGDHPPRRIGLEAEGGWGTLQRGRSLVLACEGRVCTGEVPFTVTPHHGALDEVELQAWVDVRSDLPPHPLDPVALRVSITPD